MPNTVEIRPLSRGWKRHLLQEQVSLVVISKRKALLTRRNKKRAQQVLSILLSSDQILFNGSIITWKLSIYETTRRLSLYILEVYLKFLALELLWCLTQFYLKPTHVLQAFCVILYLAVGQYKYLRNDRGFRIHQKDVAARNIIRNTVMLSITNASRNKYIILYSQGGSSDHLIVSMGLCLFASFE